MFCYPELDEKQGVSMSVVPKIYLLIFDRVFVEHPINCCFRGKIDVELTSNKKTLEELKLEKSAAASQAESLTHQVNKVRSFEANCNVLISSM